MFKTPVVKLSKFFERSRNGWKAKCLAAKRRNKLLANQARAVEKSRERWKQTAAEAQQRVREWERELEELKCSAARVEQPRDGGSLVVSTDFPAYLLRRSDAAVPGIGGGD